MKTVLVVDDEYDIVTTLETILTLEGYGVDIAFHGKEALTLLKSPPLPDLIISDVMMPVMNGYELLRELRAHEAYRHVPVILMSAAQIETDRLPPGQPPLVVRKPFDLNWLLDLINKTINDRAE